MVNNSGHKAALTQSAGNLALLGSQILSAGYATEAPPAPHNLNSLGFISSRITSTNTALLKNVRQRHDHG